MADRPDVASYKLAADTGDFVGPMKAAAGASDELAAAVAKSDVAIEKRGKTVKFSTDYFERQERKLSDAARIEYQYAKAIADADKARAAGIGTEQAYSNVVDLLNEKRKRAIDGLALQDAAMKKSATATGLARYELINLSRQFQDIGVSLAGGQSPLRIIIEQGSQILDVFASSKAAFGQVFSSMIAWAARAATSIVGIVTAVAALGVAGGALAISWVEGQRQIERALIGVGERSGLAVKDVNRVAESAAQSTRLSISAAREAAIEFIKTGEIYGENIQTAVNLTDKFALATGKSAADAAKILATHLTDTVKGAEDLNKEFGFLDGKTLGLIRSLVAAGREQEAQRVLMEKATPAIKAAADAASGWAKIWMEATQALSIYVTELQKLVTWQEKLRGFTGPIQPAAGAGRFGAARAAEQQPKGDPAAALGLDAVGKQLDALRNKWSLLADNAIRSIFAQIPAIQALEKQLTDLERAQADAAISGRMDYAKQLQPAIDAVKLKKQIEEDNLEVQQRQVVAVRQVADAYKNAAGEGKKVTVETALQLNALDKQIAVYTARNQRGVEAAVNEQKINELMLQGKSAAEAQLIITKQQQLVHLQNMTTLQEGLRVAEARTGIAKINAQYENDINQRLREGATLSQAIAEATIKRRIAIENVNTAITEQIHSLQQENELVQARLDGDYASVKAAQAYENAMRAGADATHAAALEAAVLENELVKAAASARQLEASFIKAGQAALAAGKASATAGDLAAKLAAIGTGAGGNFGGAAVGFTSPLTGTYAGAGQNSYYAQLLFEQEAKQAALAAKNAQDILNIQKSQTPGTDEYAAAQQAAAQASQTAAQASAQAAQAAQAAAQAQQEAAQAAIEAAEALRQATIQSLDVNAPNTVAALLLSGTIPQLVNAYIETGSIQFGTAQQRFETQMDLYKRAGLSNAQIAADIRAGLIGENVAPTQLLAALDSLTDAVDSNTAAQIGLSDFYTQQGDRLLGYRGYNVQTGLRSATGTGTTGTGGVVGGMPGAVATPPAQVAYEVTHPPIAGSSTAASSTNNYYYYYPPPGTAPTAPAPTQPTNTYQQQQIALLYNQPSSTSLLSSLYGQPTSMFQHGGIVDRPTLGIFGEAGPEAFVPLKGGAIPVKLTGNNDNKPTTVVNINAPLVHFAAEPSGQEVRESAFQAAQMFRRMAMGGG